MTAVGDTEFSFWGGGRKLPLIMQTEAAECALACVAMICGYHGHETDLPSLRRRFSTSLKGVKLTRLIEITHSLGFEARPLRVEMGALAALQTPCILHWNLNHFVVLSRVTHRELEIHDPARGLYRISFPEAGERFTGVALELTPGNDFTQVKDRQRISLRMLSGRVTGLKRILLQVFGIALALEVLALVMPFQIQLVVDQVLITNDLPLLFAMTAGFLVVVILQTALAITRGWMLSWLGATANSQWVINLFRHLLKLPLDFFEKRNIGDIVSRFSSIQSIQNTLTGSFVGAMLDGVMGGLAFFVMCLYDLKMTVLVTVAVLLYGGLRFVTYKALWRVNEEQLIFSARQQTELMESVRGVQAIKLGNKQSEREVRLANATIEASKRSMVSQRVGLIFGSINQGLFGVQRISLIALGGYLAIQGVLSAGMLIAFLAYADQFATKVGSLSDKLVEFKMMKLHAERVADIALAVPERHASSAYSGSEPEARLSLRNLSFRYAEGEPWVLRNLNITVGSGESVAIIGPSGCGKSTLGKIIVGLLEPTEGSIEIGGIDIRHYGVNNYRSRVGAVMQDDVLFAGSIADNISFFDESASMAQIVESAGHAQMHDEILAMPMGYESLVGDMGSALSGGQKQRILLARALYRKPKILLLDEATSHLDDDNESRINEHIRKLSLTRIVIAHRQETISSADRVIDLTGSREYGPFSMQVG